MTNWFEAHKKNQCSIFQDLCIVGIILTNTTLSMGSYLPTCKYVVRLSRIIHCDSTWALGRIEYTFVKMSYPIKTLLLLLYYLLFWR